MVIGSQIMVKELIKSLSRYGIYLIGISLFTGIFFLMLKYPPVIPVPEDGNIPPVYPSYPGLELEHRLYLEERYLEYRRSA